MSLFADLIDPGLPGYVLAAAPDGNLPGVLRDAWVEVAGQGSTLPVLTVDAAQAAAVGASVGALLTIDGTGYRIAERQPKTAGGADLALERQ